MSSHWCRRALVGDELHERVLIGVEDGRIASVELGVDPPPGARRHEGVTLPGFANAHSHAFHRALRGRTQTGAGTFWTWREQMYVAAQRLDPERYHRLARAAFAEMAMAGITAVGEFHYVHHRPGGRAYDDPNAMGRALIAAAVEAGVRITLLDTLYLWGGLAEGGYAELDDRQRRFGDGDVERWIHRVEALDRLDDASARIGAAVHSVRAADPTSIRRLGEWADARGAPVHVHASEQAAENEQCRAVHGATPIGVLGEAGVLGERCTVVHGVHVDEADIAALAASGTAVCACPTTERDLADGIAPTEHFVAAGVPLCLGSDSHAVVDMFEEMRAVEMHARVATHRRGVHDVRQLLDAATFAGQRSLGWRDAGTISVGRRADLVTVDDESVRTAGGGGHLASLVFAATAADVVDVIVDGRDVVVGREHMSVDVARELAASVEELIVG